MSESPLQTPVQFVKGVGPQRASLYERLGIQTVEDLLWDLPRDVLDLTDVRTLRELEEGEFVCVRGKVADIDARRLSGGRTLTAVLLDCGDGYLRGVWFNQPWMRQKFRPGEMVLFSGKPKRRGGRWEINNPNVQWLNEEEDGSVVSGGVLPRYRLTEGLRQEQRRRASRAAVGEYAECVRDVLPEDFRRSLQLPSLSAALRGVHAPQNMEEYRSGRKRILFDDLFEFQLGLALKRRAARSGATAPVLPTTAKIDSRIRRLFPFEFTGGQNRAVQEITADLTSGRAMHRLLQADVGAGKTVVAVYAMLVCVAAGYQTALMAPTEVLAVQHWETLEQVLAHSRVRRLLLSGQLTRAGRRAALAEIAAGNIDLVVGTQALIQSDVRFHRLGLAVIDEQHKFGVMQRAHFTLQTVKSGKQHDSPETAPHILVMTATPIPRSLCLTFFGDLDITVIDELPPGRQKIITTRIREEAGRQRMWHFVRQQLRRGRQLYVVCPRVEEGENGDSSARGETASAEATFATLQRGELRGFSVGLVHGQMDRERKNRTMEAFRHGEIQVLVSTTVIEVGVDVPNATLMVVLDAERFGLSQLHQLRGRIGRGKFQGYCFLLSDSDSEEAGRRLWTLEATTDGFRIAEADLALRGPGDVLGSRQHGNLPLKVADIRRDAELLRFAREEAFPLVESGRIETPAFAPLRRQVLDRFGEWLHLPQTG